MGELLVVILFPCRLVCRVVAVSYHLHMTAASCPLFWPCFPSSCQLFCGRVTVGMWVGRSQRGLEGVAWRLETGDQESTGYSQPFHQRKSREGETGTNNHSRRCGRWIGIKKAVATFLLSGAESDRGQPFLLESPWNVLRIDMPHWIK